MTCQLTHRLTKAQERRGDMRSGAHQDARAGRPLGAKGPHWQSADSRFSLPICGDLGLAFGFPMRNSKSVLRPLTLPHVLSATPELTHQIGGVR